MSAVGVLHLIDSLACGGAERIAVELANAMPQSRYRTFLCATREEGPLRKRIAEHVEGFCLRRRGLLDLRAARALARFIRSRGIRILHAHGTSLFIANLGSLGARRTKLIWHDHFGRLGFASRPVWAYRLLTRRVSRVLAVSRPLADWSRERLRIPAARIRYVPNFVFPSPGDQRSVELPGSVGKRLVCVANFRPQKDHGTLLEALRDVVRSQADVHVFLVGARVDEDCATAIERRMEDLRLRTHVVLLGERDDVPEILRACDVGVLCSSSEGMPLALLEYGLAGLATVATRVGQCGEVLEDGRCGVLVDPRAPRQLADAILRLLSSATDREVFGARLRERVRRDYSASSAVRTVADIYDEVLGEP